MVKLVDRYFNFTVEDTDLAPPRTYFKAKPVDSASTQFLFQNSPAYDNSAPGAVFKADLVNGVNEPYLIANKRIVYTWVVAGPEAGTGTLTFEYLKIHKSVVEPLAKDEEAYIENFLFFRDRIANNSSQASVLVKIIGANDAPIAQSDTVTISDTTRKLVIRPLRNDKDIDHGDTLKIINAEAGALPIASLFLGLQPSAGDVSWKSSTVTILTNSLLLSLGEGETLRFTIKYGIRDEHGARDTALIKVDVEGTNNSLFQGNNDANYLRGEPDADRMRGLGGNDRIEARDGGDKLDGGSGNDILIGGLGKDYLRGSGGADRFDFNKAIETTKGSGRDLILDFSRAQKDKIDLSSIDADSDHAGNQKFHFIGSAGFHGRHAELRCAGGVIQGDTNGDRVADFEIKVNVATLKAADFVL